MARDATGDLVDFIALARRFVATNPSDADMARVLERLTAYVEAQETIAAGDHLLVLRGKRPEKRYLT